MKSTAAIVQEAINFIEHEAFPLIYREQKRANSIDPITGEEILPHRLPLKRRLAEYRHGRHLRTDATTTNSSANNASVNSPSNLAATFSTNLWAVDRFRDMPASMVVTVYDESLVLEPGDVGPLPMSHPVARDLIACVNEGRLSLTLLEQMRDSGAIFYDGCAVVAVVDCRRWSFGTFPPPIAAAIARGEVEMTNAEGYAPEIHKVILKPTTETLLDEFRRFLTTSPEAAVLSHDEMMALESRLLLAVSPPICIDPSPLVNRLLTQIHWEIKSIPSLLRNHLMGKPPKLMRGDMDAGEGQEMDDLPEGMHHWSEFRTDSLEAYLKRRHLISRHPTQPGNNRFRLSLMLDEARRRRDEGAREPEYGLDARKDPAKLNLPAPPLITWLAPNQSLFRTIRFEDRPSTSNGATNNNSNSNSGGAPDNASTASSSNVPEQKTTSASALHRHYTVHIIVSHRPSATTGPSAPSQNNIRFEVVLKIGSQPCTHDLMAPGGSLRQTFASKAMVDAFVESFKMQMTMEGKQCTADVSNPHALSNLMRGVHQAMAAYPPTAMVPPPGYPMGVAPGGGRQTLVYTNQLRSISGPTHAYSMPSLGGTINPTAMAIVNTAVNAPTTAAVANNNNTMPVNAMGSSSLRHSSSAQNVPQPAPSASTTAESKRKRPSHKNTPAE